MRTFILAAFGLQILFGTSCLLQTASAQELPPAMMMSRAPVDAAAPHAGCAQRQQTPPQQQPESDVPGGAPGCLGHCLSQATNRAMSAPAVQVPGSPSMPVPIFAFAPSHALVGATSCSSGFHCSLSPPPTETIVLRQ